MIMRGLTIKGVIVGSRRMLEDLVATAAAKNLRPVIDRVYAFDQALEATRYMASGQKIGKVMIEIGGQDA
jgi:D-arabinose 1-dehydrogenase-like Zn-dependent alcohol dehydrogenase